MISKNISRKIFDKEVEKKSTRDGFGEGLIKAGEKDKDVVVLTADLGESTRANLFKEKFPERFFDTGVAEQALVTVASGMAACGKIPVAASFAVFSPGRNWEQIRTTIALNNVPVIIAGSHAGLTAGEDGATHQALEDIALMRTLPNMTVVVSCDALETKKAILALVKAKRPAYIRFERHKSPVITTDLTPFEIGKADKFWGSRDPMASIIATGPIVYEALIAAENLKEIGIEVNVINMHTIKPLDEMVLVNEARITGAVVTVENHQRVGGLGGAVSEFLGQNHPVPIDIIGVDDKFGQSGKANELMEKYGLTRRNIIDSVKKVLLRKRG